MGLVGIKNIYINFPSRYCNYSPVQWFGCGMRILSRFLGLPILLLLILSAFNTQAQVTVWSEDFSNSNELDLVGVGIPSDITGWNTEGYTGKKDKKGIYVSGGKLVASDNLKNDKALWEINLGNEIDILGYENVSISIDFSSSVGMNAGAEIQAEYSLDKGMTWISFNSSPITGDITGTQTLSVSNLNGSSLSFHFSMKTDKKDLFYYADNIFVKGYLPTNVPNCTSEIQPLDGETDVVLNQQFNWNESAATEGYKFYLGTDIPPSNIINDSVLSNNYFSYSGNLEPNTTYYWKVVPYNVVGESDGCNVWSFTTGATVSVDTTIQIPFNEGEPLYFNFPFKGCEIVTDGILHVSVQGDIKTNKNNDKFYSIVDENLNSQQFGPVDYADKCAFATNTYTISVSDLQSFSSNDTISFVAVPEDKVKDLKDCNDYVAMYLHYSYIVESPCLITGSSNVNSNETNIIYTGPADVESYQWTVTGDATINGATNGQTVSIDVGCTDFQVMLLIDGNYVNCASNCSFAVTVEDNEVPSITCSTDIITDSQDSICGAQVTYLAPVATDNCGIDTIILIEGFASGDTFPVGLTTVSYEVADVTGNKDTCSFTVTVNSTIEASVTIVVDNNPICQGENVTFTASPINGGTNPAYQWQIDGVDVSGETGSTFVNSTLTDGKKVTCAMTSDLVCIIGRPATSNEITITLNPLPTATISGDATICAGSSAAISVALTGTGPWDLTTQRNGGDDIIVTNILSSPYTFNATAAGVYTVNAVSDANCAGTTLGSATVNVNQFNLVVSDISAQPSGNHCPEFLPPFNASSGSYNPGSSEVKFKVVKNLSTSNPLSFDFSIDETGNVDVYDLISVVGNNSTINYTGDDAGGTIDATDNTEIEFTFRIINVPASQLDVIFEVSNANDGACNETGNSGDNSVTHVINIMPDLGNLN